MHLRSRRWLVFAPLLLAGCADALGPARRPAPQGPGRDMSYLLGYGYQVEAQVPIPLPEVSQSRVHDGTIPWRGTGVVLQEGDEAVLEVKGTVDVRLHPDLVATACTEMVAPLERPHQCHHGADGVLQTVGPDYYKEGWAAPMFRVGGSQLPLNFPFRGPGEIEMMRQGTWPAYYNRGLLAPYHRFTGSQTLTVYVRRKQQPELTVSCTPNPVTRGQEIRCTAGKRPTDTGELKITGWSFERRVRTDGGANSFEWNGVMVEGGAIAVEGTVGGQPARPARVTVSVTDRSWTDVLPDARIAYDVCAQRTPSCLQLPPAEYRDLGKTYLPPTSYNLPVASIDTGPNSGWWFFPGDTGPVQLPRPVTLLNPEVFDPRSDFYRHRSCNPTRVQSWVTSHEQAHVQIGRDQLRSDPINPWLERQRVFQPGAAPTRWYNGAVRRVARNLAVLMDPDHLRLSKYRSSPCDLQLAGNG